jgi:GT2 family glycosyltransferase
MIACVVLNWDGGPDTERCLRSLFDSKNVDLEVVVVDNGSDDGSLTMLEELFPQISILRQSTNLGVAKGFNIGVEWALARQHEFIFFLNNDATVEKNCIGLLRHALVSHERVCIASPRILDGSRPGRMWFDGGRRNLFGDYVHVGMSRSISDDIHTRSSEFSSGCAMLVHSQAFEAAGRFDERFFAYSEDVEWCNRTKVKGLEIVHVPSAMATHAPSSSIIRNRGKWFRDYYVTRNKLLLVRAECKGLRWALFMLYFGIKHLMLPLPFFALTGQRKRAAAVWGGFTDYVAGKFGEKHW